MPINRGNNPKNVTRQDLYHYRRHRHNSNRIISIPTQWMVVFVDFLLDFFVFSRFFFFVFIVVRLITITDAFHKLIIKSFIPFAWYWRSLKMWKVSGWYIDRYCLKTERRERKKDADSREWEWRVKKCSEAEVSQLLLA